MSNHCPSHDQRHEWCERCQEAPRDHCASHFEYADICDACRRANNEPPKPHKFFEEPPLPLGRDELDVVADAAHTRMRRAEGLQSPREFLLRGPLAVIRSLLTDAEYDTVLRFRSKLQR
jgi:hypothetical protein